MAADNEFSLTSGTVGEGGSNSHTDVFMVQLLLSAAQVLPKSGVDGRFKAGGETAKALLKFQAKWNDAVGADFCLDPANMRDPLTLLQPQDPWLLRMAAAAQLLIPMPGVSDYRGLDELHKWMKSEELVYEKAADYMGGSGRSFWPVAGFPDVAIQLQQGLKFYLNPGPIKINCTTYVNMMLAVYLFGTLSHPKYMARVKEFGAGATVHLSQKRYGFELIKSPKGAIYFRSAAEILGVVKNWEIYAMEIGSEVVVKSPTEKIQHGTGHMAVLHNGIVYESYSPKVGGRSANEWGIEQYFRDRLTSYSRWVYLFGQP